MDKRVPHLALVAGWGTFFVLFLGRNHPEAGEVDGVSGAHFLFPLAFSAAARSAYATSSASPTVMWRVVYW